jgi:predicted regulator of Ras-like GTPase activity (Roadblock/LC7/MglB family)
VLLVSQDDGSLLAKQGHSKMFDLTALAALGAGVLSATHEMARQIGEPQFTVLFQEGVDQHIYLSRAGDRAILLTIFDDRSSIGLVRVWSQTAAERLAGLVTSSAALSQY